MKKPKFKITWGVFLPLIILLAIFLLLGYIWGVLSTSDFFAVKKVYVRNSDESFDYLKGRNIFKLKLDSEAASALSHCPACRNVRFLKVLPDCIVVDFVKR